MSTSSSATATSEKQLVVFGLAGETYGVDISAVREIIQMQEITAVPGTARAVNGVTNLRGTVIPVVDLRKRFGMDVEENDKDTRIVVINSGDNQIGVIVDSVDEVLRIPADSIEPPSQMIVTSSSEYLMGIVKLADKLVILLDTDKVLSAEDYNTAAAPNTQEKKSNPKIKETVATISEPLPQEKEPSTDKDTANTIATKDEDSISGS